MAFKSEFIAERLGDFWRRFKEIDVFKGKWDGLLELASNISLNADQIDKGKSVLGVPVLHRSSPVLFRFDSTTEVAPPAGFAAAFTIDGTIVSIPQLDEQSDGVGLNLFEGASYSITSPGVISFFAVPPEFLFSQDVLTNRDIIFRNFGFPIDFRQPNSEFYLKQVQGLWYSLWNGGAINNIALGFHILLGLPFVREGTVVSVTQNPDTSHTVEVNGEQILIPSFLNPVVSQGDVIENFARLSDGTAVYDFLNNPDIFTQFDIPKPQKFFTFVPAVNADVIFDIQAQTGQIFDFSLIIDFLNRIRPAYTNFLIGIELPLKDSLEVFLESELEQILLLTKTVDINPMNFLILPDFVTVNSIPGATLADQVDAVKDLPEFALDSEVIGFLETLTVVEEASMVLTSTVGNGPIVQASPAAGFNPVNHFSIGSAFEILNGLTLIDYNAHLTDFPEYDLDLEAVAFKESLEIRDSTTNNLLVAA